MTPPRTLFLVLCCAAGALPACGGDAGDGSSDTDDGSGAPFMCLYDDLECDPAAHEVCLFQRYSGTGEAHTGECLVVPAACTDCDCAIDAAIASFDGSNNCDGMVACSQTDDAITVECTNVPF